MVTNAYSEFSADRWLRLMAAWSFQPNRETFEALRSAYSEPGRHYHTCEHVSACLGHLDDCLARVEHPREVEVALWFHDAVYRPLSRRNERDSADWAAAFLSENGAPRAEVARVHRLIGVTAHAGPARTVDEAVIVDIDLAILGADPAMYDRFENGIRREYRRVPFCIYRRKRARVLREFLERQAIYTSGCFSAAMERQARENLSRTVAVLEGRE